MQSYTKRKRDDYARYVIHRNSLAVYRYLENHPCVDCGEADPVVLDFDHVRGVKKKSVSRLLAGTFALATIFREIEKCDVRCSNCHRRITAVRGNFYRFLTEPAPKPVKPRKAIVCGTRNMYLKGCRCALCRRSNADYSIRHRFNNKIKQASVG